MRNRISVCEYCGRILVDKDIEMPLAELEKKLEQERIAAAEAKVKRPKRKTTRVKKTK
jgi:predicted  nucleic acid-binding Zn-ribbon protein